MGLKSQRVHIMVLRDLSAPEGKSSSHLEVKPKKVKVLSEGSKKAQEKGQG